MLFIVGLSSYPEHTPVLTRMEISGREGVSILLTRGVCQGHSESIDRMNKQHGTKTQTRVCRRAGAFSSLLIQIHQSLTWKYMNFMSLVTSGSSTSTVFSYISTRLGCSLHFTCGQRGLRHPDPPRQPWVTPVDLLMDSFSLLNAPRPG